MPDTIKVAVGLSGGVDSSVTAKLLIDQGYEVIGVYMKNWDESDPLCPSAEDAFDARSVAGRLGIPFYVVDFAKEYKDKVFNHFLDLNRANKTPSPDVWCNKYVKFGAFLEYAQEVGCEYVATGHYARKVENTDTGLSELHVPHDTNKDQTYFLGMISQDQLAHALFPLADIEKSEVRQIAEAEGFITADNKDSTGICFIGKRNYAEFLAQYIDHAPGDIIDLQSQRKVGEHTGLPFYTIGQRKGVGVGGQAGFTEAPFFVIAKDHENNQLIVSQDEDDLLASGLTATDISWIAGAPPGESFTCEAKVRYRSGAVACDVVLDSENATVTFHEPLRAIAPGQVVIFYDGDKVLGGGEII